MNLYHRGPATAASSHRCSSIETYRAVTAAAAVILFLGAAAGVAAVTSCSAAVAGAGKCVAASADPAPAAFVASSRSATTDKRRRGSSSSLSSTTATSRALHSRAPRAEAIRTDTDPARRSAALLGPTPWLVRASRDMMMCYPFRGRQGASAALQASKSGSSSASCGSSNKKASTKRRLYSFAEARNMARQYGFTTMQEYVEYECPGAYQLPKNPNEVYAAEWKGWDDYLGLPWSYEEGRKLARSLKVASSEQYMEMWQSSRVRQDPDFARLPYRPNKFYDDSCWKGWEDWLGTTTADPK